MYQQNFLIGITRLACWPIDIYQQILLPIIMISDMDKSIPRVDAVLPALSATLKDIYILKEAQRMALKVFLVEKMFSNGPYWL